MTISKTALTTTTLVVALLFGGGAYVATNLGSIALNMSEKIGTKALGVNVDIDTMDISIKELNVNVAGITIANPSGFSNDPAIVIKNINVGLASLAEKLITMKNIDVSGVVVNIEVANQTTNLQTIQKNITASKPKTTTEATQAKEKAADPIKVIIQRFSLDQSTLNPTITLLETQKLDPVAIPGFQLTGIGEKQNGILAQEAVKQIFSQLIENSSDAAANAGFYQGLSKDALKDLGAAQLDSIKNNLTDEIDNIGNSLKGMFQ